MEYIVLLNFLGIMQEAIQVELQLALNQVSS
jgi:hypothetical protein